MHNSPLTRHATHVCVGICVLLAVTTAPALSRAEGFFDVYGGGAFGQPTQVNHQFYGDPTVFPRPAPISTTKDLGFSPTWTVGGRAGYWLNPLPWLGLALDISYFELNSSQAEIDLIPTSFLIMLRYPLWTDDSFPKGRLQPYLGIGPSVYYSHASIDFEPPSHNVNQDSGDVGFDLRLGTLWKVSRVLGMFAEYRFSHVTLDYEKKACVPRGFSFACILPNKNPPLVTISTTESTVNTHHILVGIRF